MRSELRRLLLGLLIAIGVIAQESSLVLIGTLLLGLDVIAIAWGKAILQRMVYRSTLSHTRCWPGEELTLTIELENRSYFPVSYITCHAEIHESLTVSEQALVSAKPRRKVLSAGFHLRMWEKVRRSYQLTCTRRGRYDFGPTELSITDVFGFSTTYTRCDAKVSLLVYPCIYALDELRVTPTALQGERSVRRYFLDDPFRLVGTREYRLGDPLNRINWKATARTQKHMVHVIEPSAALDLHFVLNVATLAKAWQGVDEALVEWTIAVVASFGLQALSEHCRVGLTTNEGSADVPLGAGDAHAMALLDALAAAQSSALWRVEYVLEHVIHTRPYGTTVVLITAILEDSLASLVWTAQERGTPLFIIYTGRQAPPEMLANTCLWVEGGRAGDKNGVSA